METSEGAELCFPQLNNSCRKPMPSQLHTMLTYTLLSFISLPTVALNLLVIISISHFRQLHTPTNLLILSLAVSDFFVGLLLMPVGILSTDACWFLGDLMCALYYVADFVITSSSVGNMVLISIDRYLAICDPLRYTTRVTLNRTKVCVCLCWICSFLYNVLIVKDFLRQPDSYNSCYGECVFVLTYITGAVDLVFTFIDPVTVIIVLYMRVFMVAVSQARAMRSHIAAVTLQRSVGGTAKKSEMKAARTLGIVVVVFLMCFFPYYSPSLKGEDIEVSSSSPLVAVWLLYFNSCLNPVIYTFFYPWFRKSIKLIVTFKILRPDSCDAKIL
ncbi:LOW QUALITY PROTEIN: trace amine-associated receptor 13c-like [Cottoperca gobio]|uniref:LOW QUALITY PROTEIN: trace amine-associated receptor 13c-like n=1 Tax=Cottoperca gobio TaxID=56716 RepID=A0A6J2S0P6_COTGO|nr:LOW QUALITY PROTEIN: trace amine-associated receptor 13c-like [Cottoperca gobio]